MFNPPKTLTEAEAISYRRLLGNRLLYDPDRCAYAVMDGFHTHQCSRKHGHGAGDLYCKQHAKKVPSG